MNEQIKSMPWSVKVAVLFLLTVYITMCVMVPGFGIVISVIIGIVLSVLRIFHYFVYEN